MNRTIPALLLLGLCSLGFAQNLPLDPGVPIQQFSSNFNDGYSTGRGVWFQATSNFSVQGAGFYNGFTAGDQFTMTLYTADSTGTSLHVSTLGSFNVTAATIDGYQDGSFAGPIALTSGNYYAIEATSNATFAKNFFYNWNGPGVNLGPLTILDGYLGDNGLSNTVSPVLRLNLVPEPVSMIALGAGLAALVARRRRK